MKWIICDLVSKIKLRNCVHRKIQVFLQFFFSCVISNILYILNYYIWYLVLCGGSTTSPSPINSVVMGSLPNFAHKFKLYALFSNLLNKLREILLWREDLWNIFSKSLAFKNITKEKKWSWNSMYRNKINLSMTFKMKWK